MVQQLDVEWRVAPANRTNKNQTRLLKPHWLSQARTRKRAAKSAPNGRNGLRYPERIRALIPTDTERSMAKSNRNAKSFFKGL